MFPFDMFHFSQSRQFVAMYQSYPVSMLAGSERDDVEKGGKIIMPSSALQRLTNANITYPMMFKITNPQLNRITHCGVLEFVADEGRVYLPLWMMNNLLLKDGDIVRIENVLLPVATFSRFQPQSYEFLDISNPKAVLENCLRHFACLTAGDIISLKYNDKDYQLSVLETRPNDAVNIIECDMNVEFSPPIGYEENNFGGKALTEEETESNTDFKDLSSFFGEGHRLDGKRKSVHKSIRPQTPSRSHGIPDYDWNIGTLRFLRDSSHFQPCSSSFSNH